MTFVPIEYARRVRRRPPSAGGGSGTGGSGNTGGEVITPPASYVLHHYVRPLVSGAVSAERTKFGHPTEADRIEQRILNVPGQALWFGGYSGDISGINNLIAEVKAWNAAHPGQKSLPILSAYGLPNRDNGAASGGGMGNNDLYRQFCRSRFGLVGNTPCIIIAEADGSSLGADDGIDQPNAPEGERSPRQRRATALRDCLNIAADLCPNAFIFLDAGNAGWPGLSVLVPRILSYNLPLHRIAGYAVNTSNYFVDEDNEAYAEQLVAALASKAPNARYITDCGRNGNGRGNTHLDPAGRALGKVPMLAPNPSKPRHFARLWAKGPGGSDKAFTSAHGFYKWNNDTKQLEYRTSGVAGDWYPERANEMINNAIANGT